MSTVFGFLGTAVGFVIGLFSLAVGALVLVILWRAGVIPTLAEGFLIILRGIFVTLPVEAFQFFRDLLTFAGS